MTNPLAAIFATNVGQLLDLDGQDVTWTPAVGDASEITAVVTEGPMLSDGQMEGMVSLFGFSQARLASFLVAASDITGTPAKDDDQITWDGQTWTVRQVDRVAAGAAWKLYCTTDERGAA